ncbi:MAG TPA: platelet-activating factor acetylhydrolase IB subunit [Prosthecobacter sp.]|nr:platelet-activating factor acetylhydrolase IB subunit [Prosthecobacter sp.]HRK13124.1 platelet-activating factor acetylhydrolase IB subunit [Prosthecobacter sp.]
MKLPTLSLLALSFLLASCARERVIPVHVATTPVAEPNEAKMKRHESFNEVSKQGEATLVFLGDSITQGWEGKGKAAWEKYYASRKAANFGIGGDRTEHVLWRLENGNFDGLKPKLIVLMIGTNNTGHQNRPMPEINNQIYTCSAEQTADGVELILRKLRKKAPFADILLLGIFPRGETPEDPMRKQNEATNVLISKLADGKTIHFMDIGKTFLQSDGTLTKEIMPDLLHLSEKGYEMWAGAIEPKIKELLGE